jgi:hypothetical protein
VNSAAVAMSRPCSGTGLLNQAASGPAIALTCPSRWRTHGTTDP